MHNTYTTLQAIAHIIKNVPWVAFVTLSCITHFCTCPTRLSSFPSLYPTTAAGTTLGPQQALNKYVNQFAPRGIDFTE